MPAVLLVAATERELCPVDGVRTLCCGIGPVEAGIATARALAEREISEVLHVGIAGAANLEPGAIVIGSKSIYCDVLDVNATFPRVAELDPAQELVDAARRVLPDAVISPIATSGRVGGGRGYAVEAMEGFGVLRAAQLAGVPGVEIRVISNDPADADRSLWRIDDALKVLHRTIRTVVAELLHEVRG
jgi:nucleoside phosphorylase